MNRVVCSFLALCFLLNAACTSLRPIETSPEELQRQLVAGELVAAGDRVRLVTRDENVHTFRVTSIDRTQGLVIGKYESVPIADIVAIDTREISAGKTALLVGGLGYAIGVIIAIAIAPAALLAAG